MPTLRSRRSGSPGESSRMPVRPASPPDYLLVEHEARESFLVELRQSIRAFYGDDPVNNPDYPWIIDEKQYERLAKLAEHGRLVAGGERNPDRFCIAPTVIDGISRDDPLMEREIFGPILPVLGVSFGGGAAFDVGRASEAVGSLLFRGGAAHSGRRCLRPRVPVRWCSMTW